jgi:transcriptional regulator with XRE-family HTH domain
MIISKKGGKQRTVSKPKDRLTLGQYLEQARQEAGLSLRQLAASADVHLSSVNRLLKDEVDEPSPEHLMGLAQALDLKASDLFLLAGLPIPNELPSVDAMLRAEYGLSEQGLAEAKRAVAAIADRERSSQTDRGAGSQTPIDKES